MKRIALSKFLKNLESRWEATVAIDVEAKGWLEAYWRNNLDAAVLMNFLVIIQVLDIVHWTLELLFSGSEHWHLINFSKLSVDIFRFHQRILQSLVNQLLLLFWHVAIHVATRAATFLPLARRLNDNAIFLFTLFLLHWRISRASFLKWGDGWVMFFSRNIWSHACIYFTYTGFEVRFWVRLSALWLNYSNVIGRKHDPRLIFFRSTIACQLPLITWFNRYHSLLWRISDIYYFLTWWLLYDGYVAAWPYRSNIYINKNI